MRKLTLVIMTALFIISVNRLSAQHPIVALIDSCKAVVAAAPIGPALWTEYSQASVDGINYFINQADSISAGSDEAKKANAISDLRYYMSRFAVNPGLPAANTYSEDFNGIIKYNLWNELGGANGITQSIDNGALKFNCYSNGSMWFSEKITFSQAPQPLTMDLKEYPYVSFKAKAAPGATYDGVVVHSVNITFNDNYQPYQVSKIPADGAWHNVLFYLPNTKLETYTGYDQFWLNPGMEQGHFSSEFIGTVWIDDFKAGKAVGMPAAESDLATLIDSCNAVVAAVSIGTDPGIYSQATVDGINSFIAQAETISAGSDDALKTEAVKDLRYYMSLFKPNPAIQILDSFEENFSGIVKQEIWNTLGGANGIVPSFEKGALKYNCTANGSFWFQSQLRFWAQPLPIVMELKANPYVSFKAMAEPGATYDGFALDSVNVAFTDNYGEYQSLKIPADSTWHELTFFLTGTTSATYSGYDQWWINPGLTVADGHFSHEFVGNIWIDDFKAGKAVKMPAPGSELATLIDSCNTVIAAAPIGADPGLYTQATVDGINTFIAQAETISAGSDDALKTEAVQDLRYYMSLFKPNPAIQILDSFSEDFSGIVKQEIWNTLGGANGIVPTFEKGALKYTCTSNGSYWFQSQLRFWAKPLPIVMELKARPYVQFKAMAEPGATYDGFALDSVSVSFTDNYGEYQYLKIPADSTWHELTFFLTGTTSATYSGYDQWWVNPGLTVADGHFSHEFIGAVWIDDFKAGKGVILPDASNLAALIDSSNLAVSAVVIGDLPGQYSQQTVDAANAAIATAQAAANKIVQEQVDQAEADLRAAMSLFQANIDHTAVKNYASAELKMYPNPVSDVLTISKVNRNSTICIYSLTGQKVMKLVLGQQDEAKINLRNLKPGTYMVQMTSDKGNSIGKIIKK